MTKPLAPRRRIWYNGVGKDGTKLHVTVDSKIKSRHTANAILQQSGIKKKFEPQQ